MAKQTTQVPDQKPLVLYSALLGGVTTLFAAYDRFGLAGGLLLVAILFFSVWVLLLFEQASGGPIRKVWDHLKGLGRKPRDFFIAALFLLVLGIVLYLAGYASLRLTRKHLPLVLPNLRMTDVQFLRQRFPERLTGIRERGEDSAYREHMSAALLRWAGAFALTKKGRQLYYIESEAIPSNCDDVIVSCVTADAMTAKEVVAFLVLSQAGKELWKRPIMRQQNTIINDNGTRITITVTKPNKDERLVLVLLASSYTQQTPADQITDAAEPNHLFRNGYFEFD